MGVRLDLEMFALRDNERFQFYDEHPGDGRVLAVMARSVSMPEGAKSKERACDGAPVEAAAILACEIGAASGEWHWVQISPTSKEVIGDRMFDNGLEKDRWYFMLVTSA